MKGRYHSAPPEEYEGHVKIDAMEQWKPVLEELSKDDTSSPRPDKMVCPNCGYKPMTDYTYDKEEYIYYDQYCSRCGWDTRIEMVNPNYIKAGISNSAQPEPRKEKYIEELIVRLKEMESHHYPALDHKDCGEIAEILREQMDEIARLKEELAEEKNYSKHRDSEITELQLDIGAKDAEINSDDRFMVQMGEEADKTISNLREENETIRTERDELKNNWRKELHEFMSKMNSQLERQSAENDSLRNDLLDALECKEMRGPTALSTVLAERDFYRAAWAVEWAGVEKKNKEILELRARVKELESALGQACAMGKSLCKRGESERDVQPS
jgi:hypothetical protein